MATKSRRHTHKYHLVNMASTAVWACALPNCTHYMPDHMSKMVPGKMSICHGCGEDFILDPIAMRDPMPKCNECRGITVEGNDIPMSEAMAKYLEGKL